MNVFLEEFELTVSTALPQLLCRFLLPETQIGSSQWWKEVYAIGAPFIEVKNAQTNVVLFIWQDPHGTEEKSPTASVLLDVNSITDHHSWTPASMQRVKGTDVWFGQLEVESRWRGSYSFIPIGINQLPETVRLLGDNTLMTQRNWWMDVAKNQTFDPLNKRPVVSSGWGVSSVLHLPNAPLELGWNEWENRLLNDVSEERIQTLAWQSYVLDNKRDCWFFSTAMDDAPLVILLDGQKWNAASGTLSVLQHLTDTGKIAPAHYLLIPSIDGKTRWQELGCYRPFWESVIDDLLPIVESKLAVSNRTVSEYLVAGQSLGGLSSLYAGVTFPDVFSKVISLSGSFWWPDKDRMVDPDNTIASKPIPANSLAEQILNDQVSVSHLDVYQSVGTGEKDMCVYNEQTCQAIKGKGGCVRYEVFSGGHDWLSWRSGLIKGLLFLIPAAMAG